MEQHLRWCAPAASAYAAIRKQRKGKNMSNEKIERTLGRQLARELTEQELAVVSGGFASSESATATDLTDHTPTGNPCSDCD
jgi:hypothetical protein